MQRLCLACQSDQRRLQEFHRATDTGRDPEAVAGVRLPYAGRWAFYLAGTYICQQAILAGRIDTYVEYTGTALAAVLKLQPSGDSQAVYELVKKQYKQRFHLDVMPPLGFNNSFAMVMRGEDARQRGLTKLSQLAPISPELRLGCGYEFLEREDG